MDSYVNRRIRDKAMVFGLAADRFMICVAVMCVPVLLVLFVPVLVLLWLPWMLAVYRFFRSQGMISRLFYNNKRYPLHLKNR